MTAEQVAEHLAVTARQVRSLGQDGRLAKIMVGGRARYAPADVADFLVRNRVPPGTP